METRRNEFSLSFPISEAENRERKEGRKLRKWGEAKKGSNIGFAALSIPFPIPEEGRTRGEKRENMSSFSNKKRHEKIRKKQSVIPSIFKKEK